MKELKPGDKVKVWGAALYSAANPNSFVWHRGTQGEVISWYPKYQEDAITVRIGDDNLYFSIRQVEKIEPEKCPATISTDKMLDKCVRAKGHPDGHLWESETLKPKEPAPKPGDERCTGRGFEVFRSGGWMLGTREGFFVRRKPSTDPRYVALCALESLGSDKSLDACAIEIRMHLRNLPANFVKAGKGRNPHATPRRKDDRRG